MIRGKTVEGRGMSSWPRQVMYCGADLGVRLDGNGGAYRLVDGKRVELKVQPLAEVLRERQAKMSRFLG